MTDMPVTTVHVSAVEADMPDALLDHTAYREQLNAAVQAISPQEQQAAEDLLEFSHAEFAAKRALNRREPAFVGPAYRTGAVTMACAVIEARLRHVRRSRVERYNLQKSADTLTLAELSGLTRPHKGTSGQAFEVAVVNAIEEHDPDVLDALTDPLAALNVTGPIAGAAQIGLEGIPAEDRSDVIARLIARLPQRVRLVTGRRGRPGAVEPHLLGLQDANLRGNPNDPDTSQFHRADVLLWTEHQLVAASVKVNWNHVNRGGWRDVPLWITTRGPAASRRPSVKAQFPIHVAAVGGRWMQRLAHTETIIDNVLTSIDNDTRPPRYRTPSGLSDILWQHRDIPISELITTLKSTISAEAESLILINSDITVDTTLIDDPQITAGFTQSAEHGGLYVPSRETFLAA